MKMFEVMCRVVLTGLVLTQVSRTRPVTAEESDVLEEEEVLFQSMPRTVGSVLLSSAVKARI